VYYCCLPHAQIKFPTGKVFDQLVYLDVLTKEREWWNLLSRMLESSPKLQILKLTGVSKFISQLCFSFFPELHFKVLFLFCIT